MKLHLPPALLRPLLDTLKGTARTLIGLGTLFILPAGSTFLFMQGNNCLEEGREAPISRAGEKTELERQMDWARHEREAMGRRAHGAELSYDGEYSYAVTTLSSMTVTASGLISGPGSLTMPDRLARTGAAPASLFFRAENLITAGVLPLYNYVSHGGGLRGQRTQSATAEASASTNTASTASTTTQPIAPLAANPNEPPKLRGTMVRAVSNAAAAPIAVEGLTWTGNAGDAWDSSSRNWTDENGATSTFTSGESVTFASSGKNKDINVTTGQTVDNMTVSSTGYSFSGGGNITVQGALTIEAPEVANTSYDYPATINFGQANNITAGSITLSNGINTQTTFGGTVTADSLTITNCAHHGGKAGSYIFDGAVDIAGAFSADLGTTEDATGAAGKILLSVSGNLEAGSITLSGTGIKHFYGTVTTAGNLTVSSTADSTSRNGSTTFEEDVVIYGKKLTISEHSEAIFHKKLLTQPYVANAEVTDGAELQIELNDGHLLFDCFTTYIGNENTYSLGTVTLRGNNNGISLGSLTLADADVIGSDTTHGNDFTVGGEAKKFNIQLTNIRNLNVEGGAVNIEAASSQQIKGDLNISRAASLTLQGDNVFAAYAGDITVATASLNLGGTTQTIYGDIHLSNAASITGESGGEGGLAASGDTTLNYSGTNNSVTSTLKMGSNTLTINANPAQGATSVKDTVLTLQGDISGSGDMVLTGLGETRIESNLSYTGHVRVGYELVEREVDGVLTEVKEGTSLVLNSNEALASASGIYVDEAAELSITHGGTATVLNGSNTYTYTTLNKDGEEVSTSMNYSLFLGDGSTLTFTDLSGHGDSPALTLKGQLLFGGDVTLKFLENETDSEGNPIKLENLQTYELITSEEGINQAPGTDLGSLTVYANGKTTPLDSSQYEYGFYSVTHYQMDANGDYVLDDQGERVVEKVVRHFTLTMLAGKSWIGGAEGVWHEKAEGSSTEYKNWSSGAVGETALFREQATTPTDSNVLRDENGAVVMSSATSTTAVMKDVAITMDAPSSAQSMYMDGRTSYTITGTWTNDAKTFAASDATLVKKGSGSMTWSGVQLNLADATIHEGAVEVTGGSTLSTSGIITVADVSIDSSGNQVESARLVISGGSTLAQGKATLSAHNNQVAELHGVTISGTSADGTTSGTNDSTATISGLSATGGHTVSNAAIKGFTVDNVTFTGTGTMESLTVNENVTIGSGANYTIGNDMALLYTITNNGTVTVKAGNPTTEGGSLIGVGRQGTAETSTSGDTVSTTYTAFTGGNYVGWSDLEAENFRIRGTNLGNINDITVNTTVDGKVTVSSSTVRFIQWDKELHPNTWVTPTVGLYNNTQTRNNSTTSIVATSGSSLNSTYRYSSRVDGGSDREYVVYYGSDAGNSRGTLVGIAQNATNYTSDTNPLNIWIADEGSNWRTYVAGATSGTYYGDTHLQIAGQLSNATTIIGASQNATQHGDSFLTIEAGSYSGDTIAAGSSSSIHHGNSTLHLTGGTYGTVHGGTYQSYTSGGDTRVILDGGTVTTIYGGDYHTSSSTHSGNVVVDLRGGTVTNVYGAGGGSNNNQVSGTVNVNLYATDGQMLTSFASDANLYGGADDTSGLSSLNFVDAGTYDLSSVTISQFDRFELAQGADVLVNAAKFNTTNDLVISGPGEVTVTGSNATRHSVWLENQSTLNIRTSYYYTNYTADPADFAPIHVASGSTLDISGYPRDGDGGGSLSLRLYLAGDGTDGKGALFKGSSTDDSAQSGKSKVGIAYISLTGNASLGGDAGGTADISMIPANVTAKASVLDLQNGDTQARGYVLTKQGGNALNLYNTDVKGGTINVVEGTLATGYNSAAGNSDLVLHKGATLMLNDNQVGNKPNTGEDTGVAAEAADFNGLGVESLSGNGTVELGKKNYLYIDMNLGYTDFAPEFGTSPQAGQLFYNSSGFTYAHFDGIISDNESEGSNTIAKGGSGTQYFTGSESDYHGKTSVEGGILYLTGTSTATSFAKGSTEVAKGVVGVSTLSWEGGKIYLGDGVRIYNNGDCQASIEVLGTLVAPTMTIGVDALLNSDGSVSYYNEATYSGVLTSAGGMEKAGLGTLNVDQQGSFAGGTTITGGTLNLYGWASANDAVLTQLAGTTIMFSYDASYEGESTSELIGENTSFELRGTGDARWIDDNSRAGDDRITAALISDISAAKTMEIAGTIKDAAATEGGNVLHSGEGTLELSGANSYSGGTTVTNGTLIVGHSTGLGATASGGSANLVTRSNTHLVIEELVSATLGAVRSDVDAGNDIRGIVTIGTESQETARLTMTGDGYYATRTELGNNDMLVFRGENSSNWDRQLSADGKTPASTGDMAGAGTLAGTRSAVVVVSDAEGKGTSVYFQVTDAPKGRSTTAQAEGEDISAGYAGDLVVEGDNALLHIQGGQLSGGSFYVSGNGARIDAKRSSITVGSGQEIALRSLGDANRAPESSATLAAYSVEVLAGGHLLASKEQTTYDYNEGDLTEATQLTVEHALGSYRSEGETVYHKDPYLSNSEEYQNTTYDKFFWNTAAIPSNRQTVARLDTEGGLTMNGGSIYEIYNTNVGLAGTQLTFDVTDDQKIILRGDAAFQTYIESLEATKNMTEEEEQATQTNQWVLFSDVGSFNAILNGNNHTEGAEALPYSRMENQIYYVLAKDFLVAEYATSEPGVQTLAEGYTTSTFADNILLVYDAGARVVYLDRTPNKYPDPETDPIDYQPDVLPVPEPGTATLSLLALAALAARRRRK